MWLCVGVGHGNIRWLLSDYWIQQCACVCVYMCVCRLCTFKPPSFPNYIAALGAIGIIITVHFYYPLLLKMEWPYGVMTISHTYWPM